MFSLVSGDWFSFPSRVPVLALLVDRIRGTVAAGVDKL